MDYKNALSYVCSVNSIEKPLLTSEAFNPAINPNPDTPTQIFNGIQLRQIYNVPTVLHAYGKKKVRIATVVAYTHPNLLSDLSFYWKNYSNFGPGSNPPTVNIYTMPGATMNTSWGLEECLDIQMICTINPHADIWVVEATSRSDNDVSAAILYADLSLNADIISMSFGVTDVFSNVYNNALFMNTNKCYIASSGDSNDPWYPAVSPNVIAVGGTNLFWSPNLQSQRTEITWMNAGCGYSSSYPVPSYQNVVNTDASRCIPDVSMIAGQNSKVLIYYSGDPQNNSWYWVNGTSVSAPIFAAILSLANQLRFNEGKPALTTVYSANPLDPTPVTPPGNQIQNFLYKTVLPDSNKYASDFYDITIGNNSGGSGPTYDAGVGYDIPTGIGSPITNNLCADLLTI